MTAAIRPWTPDDYVAYLQVHNGVFVDYPRTVAEMRYDDEHRDPRCLVRRWLAEVDGQSVGFGEVSQSEEYYAPHAFWVGVTVLPAWIAAALHR